MWVGRVIIYLYQTGTKGIEQVYEKRINKAYLLEYSTWLSWRAVLALSESR